MGPVGRASAWVGRRCTHSVPNGGRCYILMPESRCGHNNTIGLTGFFRPLSLCQTSAILSLTLRKHAHISAAPTANGAYRNVARTCDEGFCDPNGTPRCP